MCNFISRTNEPTTSDVTVAVKDCIDVAGLVTTCGSAAMAHSLPAQQDAAVVRELRVAGVSILGKTNLHELAYGMTGVNSAFGTPINPYFPELITGGSSSGSAAVVATGEVTFSIGTDTGGSIRVPAACCGIAGLKPTYGRISRNGAIPVDSSLDAIGPMAKDPLILERAMQAMDPSFSPLSEVPPNLSIGRLNLPGTTSNEKAMNSLLERYCSAFQRDIKLIESPIYFKPAFDAALTIMNAEVRQSFAELDQDKLGPDVAARLANASKVTEEQITTAEQVRKDFISELEALFKITDVLLLPTLSAKPMPRSAALDGEVDLLISLYTRPFNLSGHPALVMPLTGEASEPLSIQLVTRKNEEELLFAVARQLWEVEHNGQSGIGE